MKAHRTDVVSFAFGLVFLALSVWWLLGRILGLTLPPVGWFLAGALILIGLLGLLGALRSGRHADGETVHQRPDATVAAPYVDGTPAGGEPRWSPAAAVAKEPATRELPAVEPAAPAGPGGSEAVTRELPAVDGPGQPAEPSVADGPDTDGPAAGRAERPPA